MAMGNYPPQDALNRALPVFGRVKLGDQLQHLIDAVNGLALIVDVNQGLASGGVVNGTVTATMAGTIAAADTFTLTVVNASVPSLVTPGIAVGPVAVVAGDTTTTVAAKAAAAVNAKKTLASLGIVASSAAAVATIRQPGVIANSTTITSTLSGGAVLTVTMGNSGVLASGAGIVTSTNRNTFGVPNLNTF